MGPVLTPCEYRMPSSGDECSLSAHSVCQPDSWVTGVKCGSEDEADWTIWVGASYIKRFRLFLEQPPPLLSQSTRSLTLHLKCFKSSFSAGEYQPPAGSVTAPSVCRWHTTHTWKHRVGSHGAAGCGNPANSETLADFERQRRWHFFLLLSHGNSLLLSHEQTRSDYSVGFSLDSSLKPSGFPHI